MTQKSSQHGVCQSVNIGGWGLRRPRFDPRSRRRPRQQSVDRRYPYPQLRDLEHPPPLPHDHSSRPLLLHALLCRPCAPFLPPPLQPPSLQPQRPRPPAPATLSRCSSTSLPLALAKQVVHVCPSPAAVRPPPLRRPHPPLLLPFLLPSSSSSCCPPPCCLKLHPPHNLACPRVFAWPALRRRIFIRRTTQ